VPGAAKRPNLQVNDGVFAAGHPVRVVAMYHSDAHDKRLLKIPASVAGMRQARNAFRRQPPVG
jgi:hypothetical protein